MADQLAPNLDLVIWLDIPTDTLATDRAVQALEVATGWVQEVTRQKLIAVANETVTLSLTPGHSVWLPERPVTAVGTVLTTDAYGVNTARTLNVDYTVVGAEIRWNYYLNWPTQTVTVTYSHGYATAPQTVRGVVIAAASRIIQNPGGARTQSIDDYSVTYAGGGSDVGPMLTDADKATLSPFMFPGV